MSNPEQKSCALIIYSSNDAEIQDQPRQDKTCYVFGMFTKILIY